MAAGRRSRHIFRIAALCLSALLLTGASALVFMYFRLNGNIEKYDPGKDLGSDRPTIDKQAGKSVNFLLIGSDYRSGDSDVDGAGSSGDVVGMRSDTTMLVHVSADRKRVEVVSIPRDTLVDIPECNVRDKDDDDKVLYTTEPQENTRFNSAFAKGGAKLNAGSAANCTMRTVEKLTGYKVHIDNYMVINFAAFKSIVTQLGGVPAYFEDDVDDKEAGLKVKAGCRLLNGDQALALARARKTFGDGSDLGRVNRQQELVKTIISEAMDLDLFSDSVKLYRIAKGTMKNIDTNEGFGDVENLVSLASSLQDVAPNDVKFLTMPFKHKGAYVVQRDEASKLWKNIADDKPVKMTVDPAEGTVTDADSPSQAPASAGGSAENAAKESPASPEASQSAKPSPSSKKTPVCTRNNAK